jgi:hypothetical protein
VTASAYTKKEKQKAMKVIRVKAENAKKVLAAIPGATLTVAPDYDWNSGLSDDMTAPAVNMVGIQLPDGMSGKQAHKIIQAAIAKVQ